MNRGPRGRISALFEIRKFKIFTNNIVEIFRPVVAAFKIRLVLKCCELHNAIKPKPSVTTSPAPICSIL